MPRRGDSRTPRTACVQGLVAASLSRAQWLPAPYATPCASCRVPPARPCPSNAALTATRSGSSWPQRWPTSRPGGRPLQAPTRLVAGLGAVLWCAPVWTSCFGAQLLPPQASQPPPALIIAAASSEPFSSAPPTRTYAQEFERMERDRAAEAEVRMQAAELRQLRAAGLAGVARCTATPRPHAYISEESGLPKPFPAAFKPFKPCEPPAAVATHQWAAAGGGRSPSGCSDAAVLGCDSRPATSITGPCTAGDSVA